MEGYVKLHRKILEWEWYRDINTKVLFLHLVLSANIKDCRHMGETVPRGCVVTTISRLGEETALTSREVRTAIKHLILTNEIEVKTTNRNSLIKLHNYDVYQGAAACERQTNDKQMTIERQTNDKPIIGEEERKKVRRKEKEKDANASKKKFTPPTLDEVAAYCAERKNQIDPKRFFDYFEASGWVDGTGKPVRNWKQKIITWEGRNETNTNASSQAFAGNTGEDKPKYGNYI